MGARGRNCGSSVRTLSRFSSAWPGRGAAWISASEWGSEGRRFKSCRPDCFPREALRQSRRRAFMLSLGAALPSRQSCSHRGSLQRARSDLGDSGFRPVLRLIHRMPRCPAEGFWGLLKPAATLSAGATRNVRGLAGSDPGSAMGPALGKQIWHCMILFWLAVPEAAVALGLAASLRPLDYHLLAGSYPPFVYIAEGKKRLGLAWLTVP